ncbi:MAG: response regulator [Desulfobacteraceae bacterium]|nr:response regulator [Desulfobacteraceae bacterium]
MSFSILIVDDSLPMRGVLKKTFRAAGYGGASFLEAEDGQQALEMLKGNWIDIVITDFNMPIMNGLEMIQKMKEHDLFKNIPVVVVTTEGSQEKIDEFIEQGASGYIKKPFTPEQIKELLIQLLGESTDEEEIDTAGDQFDF